MATLSLCHFYPLKNIRSCKVLLALNSGTLVGVNGSRYKKKKRNYHLGKFLNFFNKPYVTGVTFRFASQLYTDTI